MMVIGMTEPVLSMRQIFLSILGISSVVALEMIQEFGGEHQIQRHRPSHSSNDEKNNTSRCPFEPYWINPANLHIPSIRNCQVTNMTLPI